jgi:hypothetical protein
MKERLKSCMKISGCVVAVRYRTDPIIWLGSVLWDTINTHRIVEGNLQR